MNLAQSLPEHRQENSFPNTTFMSPAYALFQYLARTLQEKKLQAKLL